MDLRKIAALATGKVAVMFGVKSSAAPVKADGEVQPFLVGPNGGLLTEPAAVGAQPSSNATAVTPATDTDPFPVEEQAAPRAEANALGVIFTWPRPVGVASVTDDSGTLKTVPDVAVSSALEASRQVRTSAGNIFSITGRLDATAPNGTYYVQVLDATSLPTDGTVTHVCAPRKLVHTNGTDQAFEIVFRLGRHVNTGCFVVLSSTEFTKTIAGAYLALDAEHV